MYVCIDVLRNKCILSYKLLYSNSLVLGKIHFYVDEKDRNSCNFLDLTPSSEENSKT